MAAMVSDAAATPGVLENVSSTMPMVKAHVSMAHFAIPLFMVRTKKM